ncbi:hypothetical protein H0H93_015078 [Arthromyces matolae]|nr:hypothetical protein H0H93_015078 [Arthromyces matolae]
MLRRLLSTNAAPATSTLRYPYFVNRNSRGNLPVYSDIRNGGTRYVVVVRQIDGNPDALASDIQRNLFPKDSPEASRIQVKVQPTKHIFITGGRWRNEVTQFLQEKGF